MPSREPEKQARFLSHLNPLQAALENYCRRSVYQSNEAEDILQNAVLKAYRDFDRFEAGTNFRAWIFRYLNLEILSGNRSMARTQHDVLQFDPSFTPIDGLPETEPLQMAAAPEAILDQCDSDLAGAILELSPAERSAFLLRALGGFSYREIADVLEIPVGTVMSHLARGRRRLRERLSQASNHGQVGRFDTSQTPKSDHNGGSLPPTKTARQD